MPNQRDKTCHRISTRSDHPRLHMSSTCDTTVRFGNTATSLHNLRQDKATPLNSYVQFGATSPIRSTCTPATVQYPSPWSRTVQRDESSPPVSARLEATVLGDVSRLASPLHVTATNPLGPTTIVSLRGDYSRQPQSPRLHMLGLLSATHHYVPTQFRATTQAEHTQVRATHQPSSDSSDYLSQRRTCPGDGLYQNASIRGDGPATVLSGTDLVCATLQVIPFQPEATDQTSSSRFEATNRIRLVRYTSRRLVVPTRVSPSPSDVSCRVYSTRFEPQRRSVPLTNRGDHPPRNEAKRFPATDRIRSLRRDEPKLYAPLRRVSPIRRHPSQRDETGGFSAY